MRRTNTAQWMEKYNRWQIKVQKDGVRKTFYSSIPGRKGQREANAKAILSSCCRKTKPTIPALSQ